MEVAYDGQVQSFEEIGTSGVPDAVWEHRADALAWKARYAWFRSMTETFTVEGMIFDEIDCTDTEFCLYAMLIPSTVPFGMNPNKARIECSCSLRADLLADPERQVYVETDVLANAHGITLAVTASNYNNVIFNPATGSVHCNDAVRGAVIESLPEIALGSRFLGPMGLLVLGGPARVLQAPMRPRSASGDLECMGDHWVCHGPPMVPRPTSLIEWGVQGRGPVPREAHEHRERPSARDTYKGKR